MKKIKYFALAAFAMLSINAMAADKVVKYSASGLDYELTYTEGDPNVPKSAAVIGMTTGYTTASTITIPVTIKAEGTGADNAVKNLIFDVTEIANGAFDKKATLTSVVFAEGSKLTAIGNNAFSETGISAITLPATIKTIGNAAFAKTAISALTIPAALTSIGANFISGTNITELDFTPAAAGFGQAGIVDDAFASEKLQKVIFYTKSGETVKENNVTTIEDGWFENSFALKEVVFPTTLTEIEELAFQNTVLTTLDLSKSVAAVALGNGTKGPFNAKKTAAFSTLKTVVFPDVKAQVILANTFAYCTGLTTLTFPTKWEQATTAAAQQVAANAFLGCTGITGVTFKPAKTTGWATGGTNAAVFNVDAFKSCTATITIATISQYSTVWTPAPDNCAYGEYVNEGVDITLTSGYALLARDKAYLVDPADATVYQVYVDDDTDDADGTIYMVPFRVKSGYYQVASANYPVVIKAKNSSAAKIKIYEDAGVAASSAWAATELKRSAKDATESVSSYATSTQYVNVAAISGGKFGFTSPSGSTLAPKTYFVLSKKQYGAAGARIVWLDEEEATAIMGVKKAAKENGTIYNLAGQKVNASYKGVVIKNGKKYIQK